MRWRAVVVCVALVAAIPSLAGCKDDLEVLFAPSAEASSSVDATALVDASPYGPGSAGEALTKYLRAWVISDTEAMEALTAPSQRGSVFGSALTGVRVLTVEPAPAATKAWLGPGMMGGSLRIEQACAVTRRDGCLYGLLHERAQCVFKSDQFHVPHRPCGVGQVRPPKARWRPTSCRRRPAQATLRGAMICRPAYVSPDWTQPDGYAASRCLSFVNAAYSIQPSSPLSSTGTGSISHGWSGSA